MYFAIIGSNLTCCRENFKCHWSKNSYHVDNFSKSGVVTELVLTAIESVNFDKPPYTSDQVAMTKISITTIFSLNTHLIAWMTRFIR